MQSKRGLAQSHAPCGETESKTNLAVAGLEAVLVIVGITTTWTSAAKAIALGFPELLVKPEQGCRASPSSRVRNRRSVMPQARHRPLRQARTCSLEPIPGASATRLMITPGRHLSLMRTVSPEACSRNAWATWTVTAPKVFHSARPIDLIKRQQRIPIFLAWALLKRTLPKV